MQSRDAVVTQLVSLLASRRQAVRTEAARDAALRRLARAIVAEPEWTQTTILSPRWPDQKAA